MTKVRLLGKKMQTVYNFEDPKVVATNKKRQILLFFVVFVCPFLSLIVLCLSHIYGTDNSVIRVYETDSFLDTWESSFGPFLRKHYFEKGCIGSYNESDRGVSNEATFPWGKLHNPPKASPDQCSNIKDEAKFDCFPRGKVTEKDCGLRGCCYANNTKQGVPVCFFPKMFRSYKYTSVNRTDRGITALLAAQFKSPYGSDILNLKIDFSFISNEILFINITDNDKTRYKSPFPEEPIRYGLSENPLYEVKINNESVGFKIIRKSNNRTLFDSEDIGGFTYADQFLQISSMLPSKFIYGLGEHRNNFNLDLNWKTITLFTHDSIPMDNVNGYGYHPFYLSMEGDGNSHGVLVWNMHPMDIVLQPGPAITIRTIGGNLGLLMVLGPSPTRVVEQYTSVIGFPMLPPYWSLGFHLCRFGYKSVDDMALVWNRTRAAGIPFDTQWTDLDYMDKRNDFTVDQEHFKNLQQFVQQVHDNGMHYMLIIDPGISGGEAAGTYPPYDEGLSEKIFIMDHSGKKPFVGKVWNPKSTVFPDFSSPKVILYWLNQLKSLYDQVPFDGAWIDMNEPSNFLDGSISGCPKNNFDNPPYVPGVDGGILSSKTLCMSAIQHFGKHYDLHNLYGTFEMIVTSFAMADIRGSRPFVISRSTSFGAGKYGGHWTGDVRSTWDDMKHSVADIMSFSMFGIPMVGADICGFNGDTTPALCQRWSQLGAFYPFSRNHNSDDAVAQDPVSLGESVVNSTKKALMIRYALLPYFYTVFWKANTKGTPVIQALFMQFPKDVKTYNISTQFMWGNSLLIAPVLQESVIYVKTYIPEGIWYNFYTAERIESKGSEFASSAPLDIIPIFHRGGTIIPLQHPGVTTKESRQNPFYIFVAIGKDMKAFGQLYWDDGESIGVKEYNLLQFTSSAGKFESKVKYWGYNVKMPLSFINIYSVPLVKKVVLDSKDLEFTYNATVKVLRIDLTKRSVDLSRNITILWS